MMPTFHLDEINFEGPLTLILQLIARDRVEIRDVKISRILEQYVEYLDQMQKLDLEIAGEFVAMAAHLTYLKARALLEEEQNISEIELLLSSLEALKNREGYGFYRDAAPILAKKISFLNFTKPPEFNERNTSQRDTIDAADIYHAYVNLNNYEPLTQAAERVKNAMPAPMTYEVAAKAEEIMRFASKNHKFRIEDIFKACKSKTEIIAAFLAILELIREGNLRYEDGIITKENQN